MKTRRTLQFRTALVAAGLIATGVLIACYGDNVSSIHFYGTGFGDQKKYDFGRVPQEVMIAGWNDEPKRGGTNYGTGIPSFEDFDGEPLADPQISEAHMSYDEIRTDTYQNLQIALTKARNLEIRHRYADAATAYRAASQAKRIRSMAKDREELIELKLNNKTKGYNEYLRQRYLLEFGYEKQQATALESLKKLDADPKLLPHIQYAIAAGEKPTDDRKKRSETFISIADKFPKSQRAEAALMMAARANLENNEWNKADDQDWKTGMAIFDRLVAKVPKTRFLDNIEGWRGADQLRQKNQEAAISHYVKQSRSADSHEAWKGHQALAEIAQRDGRLVDATIHWLCQRSIAKSLHFRVSASVQIRTAFQGFNQKDAALIQARLSGSPQLLGAYLEFRLEDTTLTPTQEKQLLTYVSKNILRAKSVEKSVYGRIAQLYYSAGDYGQSLRFARFAKSEKGDVGDRARFIEAGSLERMGRHRQAMDLYEILLRRNPKSYLKHACSEQLAFLNEKHGDPVRSYELYKAIDYNEDISFLVDSELTPSQIGQLIRRADTHKERCVLKYSLSMRLFRIGDYAKARHVLECMPKEVRMQYASEIAEQKTYYDNEIKETPIDALEDVKEMQRLRRRAESARTQESRGKAIYAMAQFTHKRRNLMFYSYPLWEGGRATSYTIYWNETINKGKFEKIAHDSAYEHECDAQTLKFCREVIRRCPRSSVVPKALYSAGVAAESLSRFNGYWENFEDNLTTQASRYMKRLAREYPHHALAKSAAKYGEEFAEERKPEY